MEHPVVKMVMLATLAACDYGASFGDCEVACHAPDQCPTGLSCGSESLCRTARATQSCTIVLADARGGDGGNTPVTLTQTADTTIAPNVTDACLNPDNSSAENHWFRVFSLAQNGITTTFHVTALTFGVEQAVSGPTVRAVIGVYSGTFGDNPLDATKIAPVVTSTLVVASGGLVTEPFNQDIPGGANLVAEVDVSDENGTGRVMNLGSTLGAQARAGYHEASRCGLAAPTQTTDHLIITVSGTY